jgi:8-oxo-dGTP pyrophosphatase MutT (NUDIX family)
MVPPSFADFPALLRQALSGRKPAIAQDDDARRAAVAVVITDDADPALLFVKRLEREADPWSGHAAFPGGYRNHPDERAEQTAQRETEEETGLALGRLGTLAGLLDDVYPRSTLLPKVIVTPCVFTVPGPLPVRAVGEIAAAMWVPVREVFSSTNRKPFVLDHPAGQREFDSIHVAGLVIWGLTERILQQVSQLLS